MEEKPKKKVCIILRSHYSAVMGGAQYQAKIIVEQLLKLGGYEIYYLAAVVDPEYQNDQYKVVKFEEHQNYLSKKTMLGDVFAIRQRLEEIQPDVIYQNALTAHTAFAANYAKKRGIPFIFHIASDFDVIPGKVFAVSLGRKITEHIEKFLASKILRSNCKIVAQTERQSQLLNENYGRKANLIMANLLPFPESIAEKNSTRFKVVWVANFKPVKRPELFLKLAQELQNRTDTEFIMIGRRDNDPAFDELYKAIDAQENLTYLGPKTQDEVNNCLESSHLLVNTSDTEGYSNTYVQAWMRRVPVVALNADVDGVLASGQLGRLSRTIENMVKDVDALLQDTQLREDTGDAARQYSLENNSLKNIEKLADLMA